MTTPASSSDGKHGPSSAGASRVFGRSNDTAWHKGRVATVVTCCLVVVAWSWMDHDVGSPNERSRLYLTEAIVERGELTITAEVAEHGRIFDLAEADGEFYCDKAPATSFIAVPAYASVAAFERAPLSIATAVNVGRYLVALPIAALALLLFLGLLARLGIGEGPALLATTALCCGSVYAHYSVALYGHALAAFFVLAAAWALVRSVDANSREGSTRWAALGAFAASMSFAVEYQCAVFCIALAIAIVSSPKLRTAKTIAACAAAGAMPAALVLLYHSAVFGGPFETSYDHLSVAASADLHAGGIGGVTVPKLDALAGLLVSPARGLFATTPIFVLAIPGTRALWRCSRPIAVFIALGSSMLLFVVASTPVWMGGWSFGPRLLVPMYLVLGITVACAMDGWRDRPVRFAIATGLVVGGIVVVQAVRLTAPEVPFSVANPFVTVALPMLRDGLTSPNVLTASTALRGALTLVPVGLACAIATVTAVPRQHHRASFALVALFVATVFVVTICLLGVAIPGLDDGASGAAFVDSLRGILPE